MKIMEISNRIKGKLKQTPKHVWVLFAIISIGIFLRTYNFHDWLLFEFDQVRDATLIQQVVNGESPVPLLGPTMRASGDDSTKLFRIGPIYYYLQITSAYIFGFGADVLAYPDLLFSVLSIPLFFYFLKKYFRINLALYLTGVYAVSFFAIRYSRFAWNPNIIPFFVLLFFISIHELIVKKERTEWFWVAVLGLSFGIGIQLHAIMLLFLSAVSFLVSIYLLRQNRKLWSRLLLVIFLAFFVNVPQLASEIKTGFANTKTLLNSPVKEGKSNKKSIVSIAADSVSCNIETNAYLLSSAGDENCEYSYVKLFENSKAGKLFRESASWTKILLVFLISISGYGLLLRNGLKEQNESKRYFVNLIILFAAIFFVVMLPVIGSDFKEFRYYGPVFFIPYVLLGLILDFLIRNVKRFGMIFAFAIAAIFIALNLSSVYSMSLRLARHEGNNGHAVFLGEVEDLVGYMESNSDSKIIYAMSDKLYSGNIFNPATFVAKENAFNIIKVPSPDNIPNGSNIFYIAEIDKNMENNKIEGLEVKNLKELGKMKVYRLIK